MDPVEIIILNFEKVSVKNIIAFFDCRIGPVVVRGMRLTRGREGVFVGVPSRKVPGNKWEKIVEPDQWVMDEIHQEAVNIYDGGKPRSRVIPLSNKNYLPEDQKEDLREHYTEGVGGDDIEF